MCIANPEGKHRKNKKIPTNFTSQINQPISFQKSFIEGLQSIINESV
jgi:hypothetical protein